MTQPDGHVVKSSMYGPIGALLLLAVVGGVVLAVLMLPTIWLVLGIIGCIVIGIWVALWLSGHDFEGLFLALFAVGYFQGLIENQTVIAIPQSLWGIVKYGILVAMLIGYVLRIALGNKPFRINQGMRTWLIVWILAWLLLGLLMVEAAGASPNYTPVTTIQIFGIGNMILAIVIYFQAHPRQIEQGLRLLVWAGILAAIFGIIQWLLGADRLATLGLNVQQLQGFFYLGSDNPETGFIDLQHGFRTFSFFLSQFGFSAFLILTVIALQIMRQQTLVKRPPYIAGMIVMWAGFATTFNLTNMLTCLLALVVFALLERVKGIASTARLLLSKRVWKTTLTLIVISSIVVITVEPLRNRFVGIFDVRQGASGAGGSLAYRLEYFKNGIQALSDYPFGLGLFLSPITGYNVDFEGYARVKDYFESRGLLFTGDVWFLWLMIQVGLPIFIVYAGLFLVPIIWGWKWRKRIRNKELRTLLHGTLALLTATFISGISNSPILVFPPSNLLIWATVGVLMKIPSWDIDLLTAKAN